MVLKKPSDYFKKDIATVNDSVQELIKTPELNTFSDAFESFKSNLNKIEVLSGFSDTLDNYRVNIERVNHLSKNVEDIQTEIQSLLKKEDLDRAMMSQLLVVEQSIRDVQNKVKGINEKNLTEIRLDVSGLTQSVNEFLEVEVPQYKRLIVDSELRTDNRFNKLEENVNQTLEGIGEFVDDKYQKLTETLRGINEQSLAGILEDFKVLGNLVQEFKERDISKYKGLIIETERKTENKLNDFNELLEKTVNNLLEKIKTIESDRTDLVKIVNENIQSVIDLKDLVFSDLKENENLKIEIGKKVTDLEVEIVRNESHIKTQNKNLEQIQEDVKIAIEKLNIEKLGEKNYQLGKKVKYLEEVFEKFNEKEILVENIIVEPPSTDNKDPLTPLDKNYVTLEQLQEHYRLFINRIQQQLATIGGGGETRLKYLDDIVGIATNPSAYDGKFLKYDHSIGKFEFVTVSGGISTFSGDYNDLINQPSIPSIVGLASEGYVDNLVAISTFSGDYNDLTNTPSIPTDTGDLTNNVGFVTSGIIVGLASEGYVDSKVGLSTVGLASITYVDNLVAISTFSGDYNDLINQPPIPTDTGDLTNNVGFITATSSGSSLTGIVTSITAGSGISVDQSTGNVTISATGGGGGGAISIKDEGSTLGTAVTSINFVGSGVIATGDNSEVTVTIDGGVGIATEGGTVGTGVTLFDFRGPGISTVTVSSGIGTINIEGGGGSSTPDISPVMMGMIF